MRPIVDRRDEIQELEALADAGTPKLALLYGRRRVGKTFLLTQIWPADRAFYFTASATTPEQNRRHLVEEASRWVDEVLHPDDYPTWRTVFRMLLSLKPDQPTVVVLDEFQYLSAGAAGLREVASEFNAAWERTDNRRQVLFVLSGSAVRTIAALADGGSPLYGRFDWQARLEPFDFWDAALMVPGYSHADHLRIYGAFGGVPRYLDPVEPGHSFDKNVSRLLLGPRGEVRLQIETAIHQEEGLQDVWKYQAILTAIGSGRTRLSEIGQKAGLEVDKAFRQRIERLIDLGYARRGRNLGAGKTTPFHYRVADPAMAFYYAFVAPYETALEITDPGRLWKARLKALFQTHMGFVFEQVAKQAYYRHLADSELPIVREWGRWEGQDRNREPVEIDIATELVDGRILSGAIKHRSRPMGAGIFTQHLRDLERVASSGSHGAWAHRALEPESPLLFVSVSGFSDEFLRMTEASGRNVVAWAIDDLYRGFGATSA
ncbi:MAG: ATP-binding protein [Gemmatimonadetes bacterium]|nr:ATP-binding protein [Gemmatimonadota bacterium]